MSEPPLDAVLDNLAKFYILLLINEAPSHGYGLIRKYHNRTGRTLSAGTLYPFLQQLEQQGIVSSEDKHVGKRPRRDYSLTPKGRRYVSQLLERFGSITAAVFESNLQVCASCGCKVYEGAHIEEINGKRIAFCCKHCATAYQGQLGKSERK